MILKIPVYVETEGPLAPSDVQELVEQLRDFLYVILVKDEKTNKLVLKGFKQHLKSKGVKLSLVAYFQALEYLRTGKTGTVSSYKDSSGRK